MIMRAMEHSLPWQQVHQVLDELSLALTRFDCDRARQLLMQTVAEYRPTGDIQDLVWARKEALAHADMKNVTPLQTRRARVHPPSTPSSNQH
jgi:hypothetical protein